MCRCTWSCKRTRKRKHCHGERGRHNAKTLSLRRQVGAKNEFAERRRKDATQTVYASSEVERWKWWQGDCCEASDVICKGQAFGTRFRAAGNALYKKLGCHVPRKKKLCCDAVGLFAIPAQWPWVRSIPAHRPWASSGLFQMLESGTASCKKLGYLTITTTNDCFEHASAAMNLNLANLTLKIHHMRFVGCVNSSGTNTFMFGGDGTDDVWEIRHYVCKCKTTMSSVHRALSDESCLSTSDFLFDCAVYANDHFLQNYLTAFQLSNQVTSIVACFGT